jgi:hypothetical protein
LLGCSAVPLHDQKEDEPFEVPQLPSRKRLINLALRQSLDPRLALLGCVKLPELLPN